VPRGKRVLVPGQIAEGKIAVPRQVWVGAVVSTGVKVTGTGPFGGMV